MKRVFLDANIIFSASLTYTNMHGYFHRLVGKAELVTSREVYNETERNLLKKYPHCLPQLAEIMQKVLLVADAAVQEDMSMLREKDRHVLAAARQARADFLLTGDSRDFGAYFGKKLAGVRIMSPLLLAMELDKNA